MTDYDVCIICQENTTSEISSLGSLGYPNLLQALGLQNDDVSWRLLRDARDMDYFLDKNPKVHHLCRSRYTNIDSIVVQQKKKAKIDPLPLYENKLMKESLTMRSKQILQSEAENSFFFLCYKERSGKNDQDDTHPSGNSMRKGQQS